MSEVSTSISVEAWVVAAAGAILLLLFVWLMVLSIRFGKIRKRYNRMIADTGIDNLEQLIIHLQQSNQQQQDKLQLQNEQLQLMKDSLATIKGRVGIHRYNAFSDQGSDLSFSLAILNEKQDGVVVSGIHGREETYVYAKPLKQGDSAYALSPEEKKAVSLAMQE
ncbi:DUF4446 family protein [Paenibacillus pinihumi]|uniref:DUF4446 family protein n=1 Tax=Paenibacillus pinihumi TaxID=669462 RepID=UPI000415F708|nr:DUF4446 family protein [Paenibacillus pinihumi]